MFSDGSAFFRRSRTFFAELRRDSAPNAQSLAKLCGCSPKTAQRVIERLRDTLAAPIEYDPSRRGYYLKDLNYTLDTLPPGKEEFATLLLMRELAKELGDERLTESIDRLWDQCGRIGTLTEADLKNLSSYFTADLTEVGILTDNGVFDYLKAAFRGESIELHYKSPWRHTEVQVYFGKVLKLGLVDGRLYVIFVDESAKERVLNASFVKKFKVIDRDLVIPEIPSDKSIIDSWLYGFGVWAGEELHNIEIRIAAPASEYYEKQHWDETQEDSWEGDVLVRRMKSMLSPELVRRLLSLGSYLVAVSPQELKDMLLEELKDTLGKLEK